MRCSKITKLLNENKELKKLITRYKELEDTNIANLRYYKNIAVYAEKSYLEERERKENLMTQASYILIVISILIALIGGMLPFLINELKSFLKIFELLIFFSCPFLLLITSAILSVLIYWRSKYVALTSGFFYKKHVDENYKYYSDGEGQYYYDLFENYSKAYDSVFDKNNTRAKLAVASHITLLSAIASIIVVTILIVIKLS